jgi:uncharacterized protein YceH (UPF0502 family)
MGIELNDVEVRVLGSLVEKQLTTPEYYPLTLNALIAACNQKSNREPLMSLDEETVLTALDRLRDLNLVYLFHGSTSRAVKYKHMLPGVFDLEPDAVAVMCVLLLRGPQTVGELRERTSRMYQFTDMQEVQTTLDRLTERDDGIVIRMERQPGQKDPRYAHLLAGPPEQIVSSATRNAGRSSDGGGERIAELEGRVASLENEVRELQALFDEFKKQFE